MKKTILCFFGTRPEAIKMAPVVMELKKEKKFRVIVAVSAQHRKMLDQVLRTFGVRIDADLDVMQNKQSLQGITCRILQRFEKVLDMYQPDLVLVHGDTTTTLGGALSSYYKKIPIGHVEAGLRTHNIYEPFPEEMNRRLTDSMSTLFFAPTKASQRNLKKENVNPKNIFVTGNTVIDALLLTARRSYPIKNPHLKKTLMRIASAKEKIILMTAHRRENFGQPFENVFKSVRQLSHEFPQVHWIYPIHPNPHVQRPAYNRLKGRPNIHLFDPLEYMDLVQVLKKSTLVVTDSGGLQEEAPSLGKPVLVLRQVTERPEAVRAGTVQLVGTNPIAITQTVRRLLTHVPAYRRMANAVNPYGDGKAAHRTKEAIKWYFNLMTKKPTNFEEKR